MSDTKKDIEAAAKKEAETPTPHNRMVHGGEVRVRAKRPINEAGTNHAKGAEFVTDGERAKALGNNVEVVKKSEK